MLEKIGLPPKPAARGRSWVVDASHCQHCASPFSIFNRKHHCRRCGGLFCGNCVQSRLYLRGQGDAPVRICEPCKKLEEAARFEARHGRKKKDETRDEDELLKSLLGSETSTSEPISPESLRQQAQESKASFSALRKEGKPEEATKAFKRFKELERQADALALSLRKKKASKPSSASEEQPIQTVKSENLQPRSKPGQGGMIASERSTRSTGDEDLLSELRGLGWSEESEKKPSSDADILGESRTKASSSTAAGKLQMEILGLKRQALGLKREGKIVEAKEELKKAKILERKLEEIQTLGEDDDDEGDDGDEVGAILKALEKEVNSKQDGSGKEVPIAADGLPVFNEDDDDQVDVNETDMSDPEMIAALRAMGWAEEAGVLERISTNHVDKQQLQQEILKHKREALSLKRSGKMAEARDELKKARTLEQMLESAAAAAAQAQVEAPESSDVGDGDEDHVDVSDHDLVDPEMLAALRALGFDEGDTKKANRVLQEEVSAVKWSAATIKAQHAEMDPAAPSPTKQMKMPALTMTTTSVDDDDDGEDVRVESLNDDPELAAALKGLNLNVEMDERPPPPPPPPRRERPKLTPKVQALPERSKREIQKELLGRKRKALTLRREGKQDEAEKELEEAGVLEAQLKALEDAERIPVAIDPREDEDGDDDPEQTEVTEEDMTDPAMLAALKEMGLDQDAPARPIVKKEPARIQKESSLEGEYGEIGLLVDIVPPLFSRAPPPPPPPPTTTTSKPFLDLLTGDAFVAAVPEKTKKVVEPPVPAPPPPSPPPPPPASSSSTSERSIEQEILERKRRALQLKRSGDIAAAREELRQAKLLENRTQAAAAADDVPRPSSTPPPKEKEKTSPPSTQPPKEKEKISPPPPRPRSRVKIQQECLAHKRRALALRKEGKMDEAEAEFEIAKSLEKQLEEMDPPPRLPAGSQSAPMDGVEELLDPQLIAALSGLGWKDDEIQQQQQQPKQPPPPLPKQQQSTVAAPQELQDRVRKLKVRAVELKRAGKQREALEVLREAKALENKS